MKKYLFLLFILLNPASLFCALTENKLQKIQEVLNAYSIDPKNPWYHLKRDPQSAEIRFNSFYFDGHLCQDKSFDFKNLYDLFSAGAGILSINDFSSPLNLKFYWPMKTIKVVSTPVSFNDLFDYNPIIIESLILQSCGLTHLPKNLGTKCPKLGYLDISNNPISAPDPRFWATLKNIKYLNIENTKMLWENWDLPSIIQQALPDVQITTE